MIHSVLSLIYYTEIADRRYPKSRSRAMLYVSSYRISGAGDAHNSVDDSLGLRYEGVFFTARSGDEHGGTIIVQPVHGKTLLSEEPKQHDAESYVS